MTYTLQLLNKGQSVLWATPCRNCTASWRSAKWFSLKAVICYLWELASIDVPWITVAILQSNRGTSLCTAEQSKSLFLCPLGRSQKAILFHSRGNKLTNELQNQIPNTILCSPLIVWTDPHTWGRWWTPLLGKVHSKNTNTFCWHCCISQPTTRMYTFWMISVLNVRKV